MSLVKKHHGVVVPMVTPFTKDGRVDVPSVERLVDKLVSNGMGIFVLGTTGEASSISDDERRKMVEVTVKCAAKRSLVYAGIGDNCVSHSVSSGREFLALGVDALVAHLPSYYLLGAEEMERYFFGLAKELGRDLMIYNMPQTTRMSIPLEVVDRLSRLPQIIGFKDSENMPGRPEACAKLLVGRPNFSVFMGTALLSTKALRLGFDGLVPSSGNLVPALWREMYAKARANDWEGVNKLQERVDAVAKVFQRNRSLAQSLAALKACLAEQGLCQPEMLPPLSRVSEADRAALGHELFTLLETQENE
jgi:4-hydroxy-tetrahydrodipicolinate synthase